MDSPCFYYIDWMEYLILQNQLKIICERRKFDTNPEALAKAKAFVNLGPFLSS
jgi:hypothetical protein